MKYFYVFINKIKSFFKHLDEERLEKSNWVDLTEEELKEEDEKTKELTEKYSLFKEIVPYDIVLVNMNEHAIKDKEADSSHFTRPFLVTTKETNGSVNGYYMTGSTNTSYSNKKYKGKKSNCF